MKPPVFVIGSPRSGTTMFRLMLTSHPAIVIPPECGFAIWWHDKYGDWNARSNDERGAAFVHDLSQSKKIETWALDFERIRDEIRQHQPPSYSALVSLVYDNYARRRNPSYQRWGDKNNFHVRYVAQLHRLFPEAKFLHLIRDGRDVACSYRQLRRAAIQSQYAPNLPTDIEAIATEWKTNVELVQAGFQIVSPDHRHTLRYEDLVKQPESALCDVCKFLGEDYSPRMLQYAQLNQRDELEPREFLQWKAKTLETPDATELGKFRTELTASEIAAFQKIAGKLLESYKY